MNDAPAEGFVARKAALSLLIGVFQDAISLSDQDRTLSRLAPPERAEALRLATDTLRNLIPADALIARFAQRRPPEPARTALRLGTVAIAGGAAAHGVVNALVSAIRTHPRGRRQTGLVNAVLRRVGEAASQEGLPDKAFRLPKTFRDPLVETYSRRRVEAMERVFRLRPPTDLTLRDPSQAATWAKRLEAQILPTGSLRLSGSRTISRLDGFETGDWWVQDAAAALPVLALGDVTGKTVLDLCAAPGGKTMQLAAAGADVTAIDAVPQRMTRVSENLERTRLQAKIVTADLTEWEPPAPADAILLDAPCSATGTVRRHPELPFIRPVPDPGLPQLQATLLSRAAGWLKPGGRLVFATCSLLPEEGEAHLTTATDAGLEPVEIRIPGTEPDWSPAPGTLRLTPEFWAKEGGMDGFFIAAFTRPA